MPGENLDKPQWMEMERDHSGVEVHGGEPLHCQRFFCIAVVTRFYSVPLFAPGEQEPLNKNRYCFRQQKRRAVEAVRIGVVP